MPRSRQINALGELRILAGLSLVEAASSIGVNASTLWKYELSYGKLSLERQISLYRLYEERTKQRLHRIFSALTELSALANHPEKTRPDSLCGNGDPGQRTT